MTREIDKTVESQNPIDQARMHDVLLLLEHLFDREEETAKIIVDCLYDVGSVHLIDQKVRPRLVNRALKPVARMSKPAFRIVALRWFKKSCPQVIVDWLYSKVSFEPKGAKKKPQQSQPAKPAVVVETPPAQLLENRANRQEIQQLRGQIRLLTGSLIGAIALLGTTILFLGYELREARTVSEMSGLERIEVIGDRQ